MATAFRPRLLRLPIPRPRYQASRVQVRGYVAEKDKVAKFKGQKGEDRSEEHTSELQSPCNLVCRLLLEKKKKYATDRIGGDRADVRGGARLWRDIDWSRRMQERRSCKISCCGYGVRELRLLQRRSTMIV